MPPNRNYISCTTIQKQRLELMIGRFEYNPEGGIMDESHLRFFTKNSLHNLIIEAGLSINYFKGYSLVRKELFFLRIACL